MNATFTQRLWRGLASSAFAQIVGALNAILLVPLFLRAWGAIGYGRWLLLTAMISYLSLLDLGGQSYIGNLLAVEYVKQDEAQFRRILSAGVSFFTFISLGVCLIIVFLMTLPKLPFLGFDRPMSLDERLVITFMSTSLLISMPAGVYATAYRSTGLYARGTFIGNTMRMFCLGISAGLLWVEVSPGIYAAGVLGQSFLTAVPVIWDLQHQIPGCRRIAISFTYAKEGVAHLSGSLYFWLIALAGAISQQGVLLVLTAISPVAVALFATHRTVAGLLRYISTLLQGPLWPEFSFLWAGKRYMDMERLVVTSTGLAMLGSGVAAITVYIFFPYIYPIWTGKELVVHMPLLTVLLLQGVLAAGWSTVSWSLMASNQHRQLAILTLVNSVVMIFGAALLVHRWEALGVGIAGLLSDIACSLLIIPILASKYLQISAPRVFRTILFSLFGLMPFVVIAVLLSIYLKSWLALPAFGLCALLLTYPTEMLILGRHETKRFLNEICPSVSKYLPDIGPSKVSIRK